MGARRVDVNANILDEEELGAQIRMKRGMKNKDMQKN
jgi:gamma-glutamylcysteine synthetase